MEYDKHRTVALTTVDNPWNPFNNFDEWMQWDISHGYDSCQLLGRLCNFEGWETPQEEEEIKMNAITDLIVADPTNMYTRVFGPTDDWLEKVADEMEQEQREKVKTLKTRKKKMIITER